MGTPGVPWKVSKSQIVQALKKRHGRLTYAAKDLGCVYITLRKKIDADPELTQMVSDLRNSFDEDLLDSAEDVIKKAMESLSDLGNALKAAFYVLNNKGKLRGYLHPKVQELEGKDAEINEIVRAVREINAASGAERSKRSKLETREPLLHQESGREEDKISA